ncbi:hypothetical protein MMC11_006082 [Xylographa trunciseda]|nr:hypothetical protein [Xylographa trunciseda]
MIVPEKRPAESPANADGKSKRLKLGDADLSEQYPLVTDHVSSTILISNIPATLNVWTAITGEPHVEDGLLSMFTLERLSQIPASVILTYKSPTHAEAMLFRSSKRLSDRYGMELCLSSPLTKNAPKPRDEPPLSTGIFASTPSAEAKKPFVSTPLTGGHLGSSLNSVTPKPFSSALPAQTSFGLPHAAGVTSTSNVGAPPWTPFPGFGSAPLTNELNSAGKKSIYDTPDNNYRFGAASTSSGSEPIVKTSPSFSPLFHSAFGATPSSNEAKLPRISGPTTNMFSSPFGTSRTHRAEQPTASTINPSSTTPSQSPFDRPPRPYFLAPRPTVLPSSKCPDCNLTYGLFGECYCGREPPMNTPSQQGDSGTKPKIRVKLPPTPSVVKGEKGTKAGINAFQATCEDCGGE